jgi:SAM-dependent methyltransferase
MDIREFYEAFPYPPRDAGGQEDTPAPPSDFAAINHHVFAGHWRRDRMFRILSAGCGTGMTSTAFARHLVARGVPFSMLCIDVSQASLEIARSRAAAAGLSEVIEFRCAPIEALETHPAGCFDYIDLSGVLNHVEDPARVLAALSRVTAAPGGIGVMAYGRLGRTGIYPIQDALRSLGLAGAGDVPAARALLRALPETNWLWRNPILADFETISDVEFADRFLNPRDRAFSVRELCDLFEAVGFAPEAFLPPIVYDAGALLRDEEARRRAGALSKAEHWHLAEQLQGSLHKHSFYAVRSDGTAPSGINFADDDYRAVIREPSRRELATAFADKSGARVSIGFDHDGRRRGMALVLTKLEIELLELLCDGTAFGGIRAAFPPADIATVNAALERVCRALNSVGALYLEAASNGS